MPKRTTATTPVILSLLGLVFMVPGTTHAQWYHNLDRPGMDYRSFEVQGNRPEQCNAACMEEEQCKAWVFVRPRTPRGIGRCYLKRGVPPTEHKEGVVSSVKGSGAPPRHQATTCPPLQFETGSPLPPTVIGGEYDFKINASGGVPPLEFCAMMVPPDGTPPRCDHSPGQRFSMPLGLMLHGDGRITGQVQCVNPHLAGTDCGAGYRPLMIQVRDHCPRRPQAISKKFWIDIKPKP